MKILVACEESQAVTKELRKLGHEAYSCDLLPCSGGHPEWHIEDDVLDILDGNCWVTTMDNIDHKIPKWDMIVAFPPCTHLSCAGARWFEKKKADGLQEFAIDFFMRFANCDCEKVAIENPIGIMSRVYRKPDQIIQPYQFGDSFSKTTCLWLKGLPELKPTEIVSPGEQYISPSGKNCHFGTRSLKTSKVKN